MYKTCFLFGHAMAPSELMPKLMDALERHYQEYGIRIFMVGSRGDFDRMAAGAVKAFRREHPEVSLRLLLAYHPGERPAGLPEGFDNSYYPPLESTPRRYAIVKANQYMIDHVDSLICYVEHGGNARNLLEYARRRTNVPIDVLSGTTVTHP